MEETVFLSLGSNLGNRENNLREAIGHLQALGNPERISSFYETEPVDFTDQPWFLNCALAMQTGHTPKQLLIEVLQIEERMGRRRLQIKGPRIVDIDIVLFGDQVIHEAGLTIPHPAMAERRFVLEPLAEIAPGVIHPILKRTIVQLRAELPLNTGQVRVCA